jgi:hypothetical protein
MMEITVPNPQITLKSYRAQVTVERNGRLLTALVVGICPKCRHLHTGDLHDCVFELNFKPTRGAQ